MNQVTLVGNLTADPELRYTGSGIPVANFTVAVSHREYHDGAKQDRLDGFFDCVAWRTTAENATKTLRKGTRVVVVGKLVQRNFEDSDGNKRSAIEVQVSNVGPDLQFVSASVGPRSSAATEPDEKQGSSEDVAPAAATPDDVEQRSAEVGPSAATPADEKQPA